MYREKDLVDCLFPLVGWRQTDNPDYPQLPPSMLASESSLYYQDENPLIDIETIDQALKYYSKYVYPDWELLTIYQKQSKVTGTDLKVYESIVDNNVGIDPVLAGPEWIEVNPFTQKLESITRSAINKAINRIFIDKKLKEVTKTLLENVQLFEGAGSLLNKEIKLDRFVGFELRISENRDLITVLRRLGTQFTQANPDFKLYIFHSSQETPIYTLTLALSKVNSFEWTALNDNGEEISLKYLADDYSPGGAFYIGYYEEELLGQAIFNNYNFADGPSCSSCGNNYRLWAAWSEWIEVSPISISAANIAGKKPSENAGVPLLWDIRTNQYQYSRNFGLNLDVSVKCDATDFICRERDILSQVILKAVSVEILTYIAYSTRNNVISKETRDLALFELNNRDNGSKGAGAKLDEAVKTVSFDLSDLSDACLPCNDKYGSSWGAF